MERRRCPVGNSAPAHTRVGNQTVRFSGSDMRFFFFLMRRETLTGLKIRLSLKARQNWIAQEQLAWLPTWQCWMPLSVVVGHVTFSFFSFFNLYRVASMSILLTLLRDCVEALLVILTLAVSSSSVSKHSNWHDSVLLQTNIINPCEITLSGTHDEMFISTARLISTSLLLIAISWWHHKESHWSLRAEYYRELRYSVLLYSFSTPVIFIRYCKSQIQSTLGLPCAWILIRIQSRLSFDGLESGLI